jgi:hypothetical protein
LNTAKLDAETEELKHKTVDISVGKVKAFLSIDVVFVRDRLFIS